MANSNPPNQFKPGQSGNPNGRPPKGYSITETVRAMLKARPEVKQALGNKILAKALEGDVTAMKMLWQYMDGMPAQTMKMEGDINRPLGVVILPAVKHEQPTNPMGEQNA